MPAPFLTTLVLALVPTFDFTLIPIPMGTVMTETGVYAAASNVARTKIKDTHDENIRSFPTLKLQQETSMAETSNT